MKAAENIEFPTFIPNFRKETVVLLAGGNGTRMGEEFQQRQKCCLELGDLPILAHLLRELCGVFPAMNLLVAVSHQAAEVEQTLKAHLPESSSATCIPHARGADLIGAYDSMRAVLCGTASKQRPFLRVSGDVLTHTRVFERTWQQREELGVVVTATANSRVDEVESHFLMQPKAEQPLLLGAYASPSETSALDSFFRDMSIMVWQSPEVLFEWIEKLYSVSQRHGGSSFRMLDTLRKLDQVGLHTTDAAWVHVGYPEDLQKVWPPTSDRSGVHSGV